MRRRSGAWELVAGAAGRSGVGVQRRRGKMGDEVGVEVSRRHRTSKGTGVGVTPPRCRAEGMEGANARHGESARTSLVVAVEECRYVSHESIEESCWRAVCAPGKSRTKCARWGCRKKPTTEGTHCQGVRCYRASTVWPVPVRGEEKKTGKR